MIHGGTGPSGEVSRGLGPGREVLRHALTLMLLGALTFVLYRERELLATAFDMRAADFLLISVFSLAAWLVTVAAQAVLLRAIGIRLGFVELFALYLGAALFNYIPLRVGTIYRAHHLKRRAGLGYLRFGVFSATNTLMLASLVGLMGLVGLLLGSATSTTSALLLGGAFLGLSVAAAALMFLPLPRFQGTSLPRKAWNDLAEGRDVFARHRWTLVMACVPYALSVILGAARFIGAYRTLGQETELPGILVVGAANTVGALISVTPGGLGIQELLAGTAVTQIGVSLGIGVVAAMLVRAVMLPWQILLGLPSLAWLRSRPARVALAEATSAQLARSEVDD